MNQLTMLTGAIGLRFRLSNPKRFAAPLAILGASAATVFVVQSDEEDGNDSTRNYSLTGFAQTSQCQAQTEQPAPVSSFATSVTAQPASSFATTVTNTAPCTPSTPNKKKKKEIAPVVANKAGPFRLEDVYEIEKLLGEGAYGNVYQARRKLDGTVVALKTMPREFTGKTEFEREVAALQLLSKPSSGGPHAHIVQLYDLHRDNKNYYLAMELIEGGELLEHLINNGPYSEALAASFLRQFAEAICFLHSNGLAHADLKPENLLLSSNDTNKAQLKVADFGCACSHDLSRKDMHLPKDEFAIGCSFLHMVALGNQFELERLLQERPGLVNFRDYDFRTPLHLAASEGHVDICRFLIQKGAKINRNDRWGGSPLDDAHRHRHADVIQYLRQHGAAFGTPSQLPRFIQAASEGDRDEVLALLEFGNIDLDEGDYDKRTALHLAAGEGRIDIVETLCDAGADVNVEDRWGNRPMDDAVNAKNNSEAIIHLLQQYGAKSVKNPSANKKHAKKNLLMPTKPTKKKKKKEDETISGTIAYWPPELFADGATPTPSSDQWAAGVIMYVLLTGSHPFDKYADLTDKQIQESILKVGFDKEDHMKLMNEMVFDERIEGLSDSCIELMRHLMHPDPQQRMTSEKFLKHPWIQGLTASWTTMGKAHEELKAFWQTRFRTEIVKKFAAGLGISADKEVTESDLKAMFSAMDTKKNGILDFEEIQAALHEVGVTDQNIQTIFACADLDGTGVIHFDEFKALLVNKKNGDEKGPGLNVDYLRKRFKSRILKRFKTDEKVASDKTKLREIFNSIDLEGNGVLDPHDIRVVLRSTGEPDDVISRIVASLDLNRDGKVSWDDFVLIMGTEE